MPKNSWLWCHGEPGSGVFYMDQCHAYQVRIPEKGSIPQTNSILTQILHRSKTELVPVLHTPTTSHLNQFLIYHQGSDVADGTEDYSWEVVPPSLSFFWRVRLKHPRNLFNLLSGDFLTWHIIHWQQEMSPYQSFGLCSHSLKIVYSILSWSCLPRSLLWRSKTTEGYIFSLY